MSSAITQLSSSGYRQYTANKPSGVEWLGDIPDDWQVKRLRFLMKLNPSKDEIEGLPLHTEISFVPMEAVSEDGLVALDRVKPLGEVKDGYTYFADGDVVVAKITPCFENGKGALMKSLVNRIGFGTTEFHVLRPSEIDAKFLYLLTTTMPFRAFGEAEMKGAAGQKRVPENFIKDFRLGVPPLSHQKHIIHFLDRKTALIDEVIAKKQRLITLLKEKRRALITQAVTKGLDPNVRFKPSGIDWLGDIPDGWQVKRLKYVAESNLRSLAESTSEELSFRYLDIGNVGTGYIISEPVEMTFGNAPSRARRVVCKDETIISTVRTYLKAIYYFDSDPHDLIVSTGFAVIRPGTDIAPKYFYYLSLSDNYIDSIVSHSYGVSYPAINESLLMTLPIWYPNPQVQKTIVEYLDRETNKIDQTIDKVQSQIERLREYRQALITAAVTGKIMVE